MKQTTKSSFSPQRAVERPRKSKKSICTFRKRMRGNTIYSVGFQSERKEEEGEETLASESRAPPAVISCTIPTS